MRFPEGLPELPFGMKWEPVAEREDMLQADLFLALETRLHILVFRYSSKVSGGSFSWGCKVSLRVESMKGSHGLHLEGRAADTIQEAAKAAIDLLAPFVQLSTLGGK